MAYRKVLQWPDKSLQVKSEDVVSDEENILSDLLTDMIDTLKIEKGAGLAAPQIGVNQNVVVIDLAEMESPSSITEKLSDELVEGRYWFLLNPTLNTSRETQRWSEGCLSVPWVTAEVERATVCDTSYYTTNFEPKNLNVPWPLAGALQHEIDHLLGKLFLDRISRLKSSRLKKSIAKKRNKIESYRENLLNDPSEKRVGKNKKNTHIGKKELLKRRKTKKRNMKRN